MSKPTIAGCLALWILYACVCTDRQPVYDKSERAVVDVEQLLEDKLQCPRPIRLWHHCFQSSAQIDADVLAVSGYIEITNHIMTWSATARDQADSWNIAKLRIGNHPVDEQGRILPGQEEDTSRGLVAFRATVDYMRENLKSAGTVTFSPPTSPECGWTNVGANLWMVHGMVRVGNEKSTWSATLEDHGARWKFQKLKIGASLVVGGGTVLGGGSDPRRSGFLQGAR